MDLWDPGLGVGTVEVVAPVCSYPELRIQILSHPSLTDYRVSSAATLPNRCKAPIGWENKKEDATS